MRDSNLEVLSQSSEGSVVGPEHSLLDVLLGAGVDQGHDEDGEVGNGACNASAHDILLKVDYKEVAPTDVHDGPNHGANQGNIVLTHLAQEFALRIEQTVEVDARQEGNGVGLGVVGGLRVLFEEDEDSLDVEDNGDDRDEETGDDEP